MTSEEAIDIVARHVLAMLADAVAEKWEDYPEVGENDWEEICAAVVMLAPLPESGYAEAYALLTARADASAR